MDKYTATEMAFKHGYEKGYEAGLAEREKTVCQLRKQWQAAETLICTMCGHFDHKKDGNIVYGNKNCGEIVGYPFCGKFTPWIPVSERLPDEHESIFARMYGTRNWMPGMFLKTSCTVIASIEHEKGTRIVRPMHTKDGEWNLDNMPWAKKVTHWMPLPEPPKEV